jgi:hypothetical protein
MEFAVGGELHRLIRSYNEREGGTFFRFMLGSYLLALQSMLGGRPVTVGVPVNMRRTEEEQGLVGCLMNSLPVTMGESREASIKGYLASVDRQVNDAFRHAHVPGLLAIEEWKRVRNIRSYKHPKTIFNFIEGSSEELRRSLELGDLGVEHVSWRRRRIHAERLGIQMYNTTGPAGEGKVLVNASYGGTGLTRGNVEGLLDRWLTVTRHCLDDAGIEERGADFTACDVYAFPGGSGGFEEIAKFQRLGESLGEGYRVHAMPDPEACFGRLPAKRVEEVAAVHAERIMRRGVPKGRLWLLGEGIGGVDAFEVACELQKAGVKEVGLIIVDGEAPNASDKKESSTPKAINSYERMPDRRSLLAEALFDLRLKASVAGPSKYWLRLVPKSRRQVYRLALACGLFDPAWYRERYKVEGGTDEELFAEYLRDGWRKCYLPSVGFHAHRYARAMEGFVPGLDEPVLHAFLFGMRLGRGRKKILEIRREPLERLDIVSVRSHLRMNLYEPGLFKGDLHLLLRREDYDSGTNLGWGRLVECDVYRHLAVMDTDESRSLCENNEMLKQIFQ